MHPPSAFTINSNTYLVLVRIFFYCTIFLFLIYFDQFRLFSPAFILKLLNGGSVPNHKTFGPAQLCLPSYAGGLSSIVLVQQQLYAFFSVKNFPSVLAARVLLAECSTSPSISQSVAKNHVEKFNHGKCSLQIPVFQSSTWKNRTSVSDFFIKKNIQFNVMSVFLCLNKNPYSHSIVGEWIKDRLFKSEFQLLRFEENIPTHYLPIWQISNLCYLIALSKI